MCFVIAVKAGTGDLGFEEHIGEEYVRLWDFDELVEMNKGYGITDNMTKTLGIGGNGVGNLLQLYYSMTIIELFYHHLLTLTNNIILKLEYHLQTFCCV